MKNFSLKICSLFLTTGICFLFVLLFYPTTIGCAIHCLSEEQTLLEAYENHEIIRLHVIANSNTDYDQTIKYAVRDAIIDSFDKLIQEKHLQNSDKLFVFLQQNQNVFLRSAQETAISYGFKGNVAIEAGIMLLPEKEYGSIILPEGNYRALRIILGEGKGKNWWCILYPQLCLALSEKENTSQNSSLFFSSADIMRHWLLCFN